MWTALTVLTVTCYIKSSWTWLYTQWCKLAWMAHRLSTAGCCRGPQTVCQLHWHTLDPLYMLPGIGRFARRRRIAVCSWSGIGCRSRRCGRRKRRGQRYRWRCRGEPLEMPGYSNWSEKRSKLKFVQIICKYTLNHSNCCQSHQWHVVLGLQYGKSSTQNLSSVVFLSGRVSGQGHWPQSNHIRVSEEEKQER